MDAGCVCVAGAALRSTSVSFCVAGAALGAPPSPFCAASAARGAPPERSEEVRRRFSTVDTGYVCEALGAPQSHFAWRGAALGAPQFHFAWQVQHLEHLQRRPRKSGED